MGYRGAKDADERSFYREQLSDLLLPSPNFIIAALFYLFFAITVVVLAILPRLETGSAWTAIGYGALLGLAAYGTYDITNLSALKGWPVALSVVDIAWGTILTAGASGCGYLAARTWGIGQESIAIVAGTVDLKSLCGTL